MANLSKRNLEPERYIQIDEAAAFTGLAKTTIYTKSSRGEIPSYSVGGRRLLFLKSELANWMQQYKRPSKLFAV